MHVHGEVRSLPQNYFEYDILPYYVFATKGTTLYAQEISTKKIFKSTNGGDSWGSALTTLTQIVSAGALTDSGHLVIIDSVGTIFHSNNDVTFTSVLTGVFPPLVNGIDVIGDTIIFGEYTTSTPVTLRLMKSTDGGLTWAATMTTDSSSIRHFHTVKWLPEANLWVATSGDAPSETNVWISTDASTWTLKATGSEYRMVGVTAIPTKTLIWASDNAPNNFIYAGQYDDLVNRYRKIGIIDGHAMGIAGNKNVIVVVARIESTDSDDSLLSPVYVSADGGRTWARETVLSQTGFAAAGGYGIVGPDREGRFFISFRGTIKESSNSFGTLRAVPKNEFHLEQSPLGYSRSDHPYQFAAASTSPRATSAAYGLPMPHTIFDPLIVVTNTTDQDGILKVSNGVNPIKDNAGADISKTIVKTPGAPQAVHIRGSDIGLNIIPAGYIFGTAAAVAPTSGSVTITVYGRIQQFDDHRLLS